MAGIQQLLLEEAINKAQVDGILNLAFSGRLLLGTEIPNSDFLFEYERLSAFPDLQPNIAIDDSAMELIASLKGLRALSLWGQKGVTTNGFWQLLGVSLETLDISGTSVNEMGLKVIDHFEALRFLNLSGIPISESIVKKLSGLGRIESLGLANTVLSENSILELGRLAMLRELDLSGNIIPNMFSFRNCFISKLRLGNAEISEVALKKIAQFTRIQYLDISNSILPDNAADYLQKLRQLRYLDMRNSSINGSRIKLLRQLPFGCQVPL